MALPTLPALGLSRLCGSRFLSWRFHHSRCRIGRSCGAYFINRCALARSGWQFCNDCPITDMPRWNYHGSMKLIPVRLALDLILGPTRMGCRPHSASFGMVAVLPLGDFRRDGVRVSHLARKYRFHRAGIGTLIRHNEREPTCARDQSDNVFAFTPLHAGQGSRKGSHIATR